MAAGLRATMCEDIEIASTHNINKMYIICSNSIVEYELNTYILIYISVIYSDHIMYQYCDEMKRNYLCTNALLTC